MHWTCSILVKWKCWRENYLCWLPKFIHARQYFQESVYVWVVHVQVDAVENYQPHTCVQFGVVGLPVRTTTCCSGRNLNLNWFCCCSREFGLPRNCLIAKLITAGLLALHCHLLFACCNKWYFSRIYCVLKKFLFSEFNINFVWYFLHAPCIFRNKYDRFNRPLNSFESFHQFCADALISMKVSILCILWVSPRL